MTAAARGEWRLESRCLVCGNPACDHIPLRYALRAWLMHMLPAAICRQLRRPRRR